MSVVMKGGTSGNRFDAKVPMPEGKSQPLLDTATNKVTSNVYFTSEHSRQTHPASAATPDFMPKGCTVPENSTDVADPEA